MSRKVVVNPEDTLSFVARLSVDVSRFHCHFIPRKIGVKELKGGLSKWGAHNTLTGILMGLVLANYQPELASAAVKQMNGQDSRSADNLLDSMLLCNKLYAEEVGALPLETPFFLEISNWALPHLAMKDFSMRPDLAPNPNINSSYMLPL